MSWRFLSTLCLTFAAIQRFCSQAPEEGRQVLQNVIFETEDKCLNLLQSHARVGHVTSSGAASKKNTSEGDHFSRFATHQKPFCRELTDRGIYQTVLAKVGTPAQEFDLVVDTGSNIFSLPSCNCIVSGSCGGLTKCFRSGASRSFDIKLFERNGHNMTRVIQLYFGEGNMKCVVGTDVVRIGKAMSRMKDSIFLMEERDLPVPESFEGLLGLGRPRSPNLNVDVSMKKDLFLKTAGVDRYSLCFNSDGPGAFRLHLPELTNPMASLGELHWALDFQGMSVGRAEADDVLFCHPSTKLEHQQTACVAEPDSGTTMIKGPRSQIMKLFGALCKRWPRCVQYHREQSETGIDRSVAFQGLLTNCRQWLPESDGLDEIPSINVHLAGLDGKQQTIELSAYSWVSETSYPVLSFIQQNLFQNTSSKVFPKEGSTAPFCSTMFEPHTMETDLNGPVWLLGTALFYEKVVHFDIGSRPPLIEIGNSPCNSCESEASLKDALDARAGRRSRRKMRRLDTFPRSPQRDFSGIL